MLVGVIVAIFLLLLALSVAAPRMAQELRREREVEAVHRADQYVRAIQLYYRKNGSYPGSIEQLEKSNNIRYLRQRYLDPMTGKADWRLIHTGEAKTTVKGFFGQPLAGIGGGAGGLGSAAGMASPGMSGSSSLGMGSGSSTTPPGSTLGGSAIGGTSAPTIVGQGMGDNSPAGASGPGNTVGPGSTGSTSGSNGIASQSATSFTGVGAPIVGVGSSAKGDSIVVVDEQKTYPTWEFLYDPRIEQLKAKASLFGGAPSAGNATGLGSAGSLGTGIGGSGMGAPGTGSNNTGGITGGGSMGSTPPTGPGAPAPPQ